MAFKVGDKFVLGGLPGEVIKVDATFTPPVYTVLMQQPAVRVLTEQQLATQAAQVQQAQQPATTASPAVS